MKKEMLINVLQPEECRIAILEDGVLEELYVERTSHESYVGNIYKGRIVNIEPSIQAAFVDFGVGRNGFLHVSDVEPAYYRHLEGRHGRRGAHGARGRGRHVRDDEPRRRSTEEDLDAPPKEEQDDVQRSEGGRGEQRGRGRGRRQSGMPAADFSPPLAEGFEESISPAPPPHDPPQDDPAQD